jgi:hypothetical protein
MLEAGEHLGSVLHTVVEFDHPQQECGCPDYIVFGVALENAARARCGAVPAAVTSG